MRVYNHEKEVNGWVDASDREWLEQPDAGDPYYYPDAPDSCVWTVGAETETETEAAKEKEADSDFRPF
jgi:hypothetical protein